MRDKDGEQLDPRDRTTESPPALPAPSSQGFAAPLSPRVPQRQTLTGNEATMDASDFDPGVLARTQEAPRAPEPSTRTPDSTPRTPDSAGRAAPAPRPSVPRMEAVRPPPAPAGPPSAPSLSALRALAIVGEKALAQGRTDEAERVLSRSLGDALEWAKRGELSAEAAEIAAAMGARLAIATGAGRWFDYAIAVYAALNDVAPAQVVDQLYAAMPKLKVVNKAAYRAYAASLKAGAADSPARRFLLQRIEGLGRMVDNEVKVQMSSRGARGQEMRGEAFFERLLQATPDAIVITNSIGDIMLVNDQAIELFGYTRDEMVGQKVELLIPERFRARHPAHRDAYERSPKSRPMGSAAMSLFALRKDGTEFPAEISLGPVETSEGSWVLTAVRDVTKHRQQEAALRRATEAALGASRELEAFSYSVAHDLRAPLRSIDGFSQALLEDYEDKLDDEGREHLRRVRAAAQRMAQLIDDLLGLSRVTRSELRRTDIDVTAIAGEIIDRLRKASPGRAARAEIQAGLTAHADSRLVGIALENLIGNAWKFTSKREETVIEVGAAEIDGERTFFVRDNGAGFDMAYASKLFGAFQRLHQRSDFDGTGIGLATVQRIVLRHGGRIWGEGAVDKGATFWFTLPAS